MQTFWTQIWGLDKHKWNERIRQHFGKNNPNILCTEEVVGGLLCQSATSIFYFQASQLTSGNSLACFSFCSEERSRQVQPERWRILYCLPHFTKQIGLFSACGLAQMNTEASEVKKKKEMPHVAPCESCNFLSESCHTADAWAHLQLWRSANMWYYCIHLTVGLWFACGVLQGLFHRAQ